MSHSEHKAPKRETITRTEMHPNGQPWQWGYDAAKDGYTESTCPWQVGTLSNEQWKAGFLAGAQEILTQ